MRNIDRNKGFGVLRNERDEVYATTDGCVILFASQTPDEVLASLAGCRADGRFPTADQLRNLVSDAIGQIGDATSVTVDKHTRPDAPSVQRLSEKCAEDRASAFALIAQGAQLQNEITVRSGMESLRAAGEIMDGPAAHALVVGIQHFDVRLLKRALREVTATEIVVTPGKAELSPATFLARNKRGVTVAWGIIMPIRK